MQEVRADEAAREAATAAELFAAARRRAARAPPPRFLVGAAQTMARHAGLADEALGARVAAMALWQIHLPWALSADPGLFYDPGARVPASYRILRDGLIEVRGRPVFVMAGFHMAAFPLLAALLAQANSEVTGQRGHVLVAQRNAAWLDFPGGRWVREVAHVLTTSPGDLRRLLGGLRGGEVRRLMILSDGPRLPGARGVRALHGFSPGLGFSDGLLRRLLDMAAPIRPISHCWPGERLEVRWHPFLPSTPATAGVDAFAALLEDLLRRYPEQWLNWATAAAVRA
jgi:hypothetical protein